MGDATTTMIDHAKLACALVALAQGDLGALDRGNLASAAAIERLGHVLHVLHQAVSACCTHCADDMLHYTDGRAVASHLRFGDGTEFVYAWHPEPGGIG
jgi:hypothetical protein